MPQGPFEDPAVIDRANNSRFTIRDEYKIYGRLNPV
jgi:hypothetical protein